MNNYFSFNCGRVKLFLTVVMVLLISLPVNAQLRSKIEGRVIEAGTGEALPGVNVVLLDTRLGSATDLNGHYVIINVPVGTYSIRASMIGYNKQLFVDVIVSSDRVTKIDFELSPEAVTSEEVIVIAKRNELHKEVSNTQLVVTDEQLNNAAGIRDINAFLEKQPGVSSERGFLEIRGGSADQTGTFINGMSYNNAAVGNSETTIPLSAIDQVSLLSGGFNAEYGNFRSGLINVTTKSGKDKYSGTITLQRNLSHMKRFGPKLSDPLSSALAPFLNARVAFQGTETAWADDQYAREQHENFDGWIRQAEIFNEGRPANRQATPLDYYLLAAWMHMAVPDYEGLAELGYTVPEEQKKLFAGHARNEEGIDYNIDAGFGGPIPLIGSVLGKSTFYISHSTKDNYYVVPFARRSQQTYTTLGTIKTHPVSSLTVTFDGLIKKQKGLSPLRPAFGDSPDAGREGGFMMVNNLKDISRISSIDGGTNYWFDIPIYPVLEQNTVMGGVNINHVLSNTTYWELKASYLSIKDFSPTGDNRNNSVVTTFGPFPVSEMPYGKLQFANNNRLITIIGNDTIDYTYPGYDALPGISRRFRSKEGDLYTNVHTQQMNLKFDIVSQFGMHHYFKSGIDYNMLDIDHKLWLKWNRTGPYNSFEYNYHRFPSQTGAYIQDQVTYSGIIANLGVRFDYFYGGGGKWPTGDLFSEAFTSSFGGAPASAGAEADSFYAALASGRSLIWEKWEQYDKENPGFLQPIRNHFTISPRLGLSFPVTERSKFYFNYGHFRSNPPYFSMYLIRYRYDKNGVYEMSNPNLAPPKTVSYELGVAYDLANQIIITLSGYYKDVTGQHGEVNFVNSSGTVNYDRWDNNNYEDIEGFEVNIKKNDLSWITGWVNFNYMLKKSGLTGRSRISDVPFDEQRMGLYRGDEDRFLPRPIFNANITLKSPDDLFSSTVLNAVTSDWRMTFFAEWRAGQYFTYDPLNLKYLSNNLQWPDYYMVDLRLSKTVKLFGFNSTFFVDVTNLLNHKVSLLYSGFAFRRKTDEPGSFTGWSDTKNYLASLRLPMYNSPEFDELRSKNPGYYLPGDDKPGELRSADKPYINDPDYSYFLYGQPRDVWFGFKIDF
jgi:outer membrane receptor protein involved in Fe transport